MIGFTYTVGRQWHGLMAQHSMALLMIPELVNSQGSTSDDADMSDEENGYNIL